LGPISQEILSYEVDGILDITHQAMMKSLRSWYQYTSLPSGKHTKNYGKSPFSMGKSTISIAIFNSYVELPEGMS
jgi:hypothetical protein